MPRRAGTAHALSNGMELIEFRSRLEELHSRIRHLISEVDHVRAGAIEARIDAENHAQSNVLLRNAARDALAGVLSRGRVEESRFVAPGIPLSHEDSSDGDDH